MTKSKTYSYDGWSRIIKNIKLTEREPVWQKAITIMIDEGDLAPTAFLTLSQECLQNIVFAKGINDDEVSIYEILTDLANWVQAGDNIAWYLSRYFFDGADVMLAYVMATQYGLYWNGDTNIMEWESRKDRHEQAD